MSTAIACINGGPLPDSVQDLVDEYSGPTESAAARTKQKRNLVSKLFKILDEMTPSRTGNKGIRKQEDILIDGECHCINPTKHD
jgi:hypothetical protein